MDEEITKKPRGRPNHSFSKQRSAPFRASIAARQIKSFAVPNANLANPQADLVYRSLNELISPSMFCSYWDGKNSPSKATLNKIAKAGLDLRPLFISLDEIYKSGTINHAVRHLLTIDLISSNSITHKEKRILARRILDDIDSDWTPCDERIFFTQLEEKQPPSQWIGETHQLHPRARRVDRSYLLNYDPYNMLSLVPWLISIVPLYNSKPFDLERLSMDLLSSSLCLMTLGSISSSNSFGAPAYSYQSSFLSSIPELVLIKEKSITAQTIDKLLNDLPSICPDNKPNKTGLLEKSSRKIYQSYDSWLKKYGLSKQEIAIAMGFCDLEMAQDLELFDY